MMHMIGTLLLSHFPANPAAIDACIADSFALHAFSNQAPGIIVRGGPPYLFSSGPLAQQIVIILAVGCHGHKGCSSPVACRVCSCLATWASVCNYTEPCYSKT